MIPTVHLDPDAGFCSGVRKAIKSAENHLKTHESLDCIGQIVHNQAEVERLNKMGLRIISLDQVSKKNRGTVMIRAHGEPPSTYGNLKRHGIQYIDATCPLVLKLQHEIRQLQEWVTKENGQVAIFGLRGHPEVIGLAGQLEDGVIVIQDIKDLESIDTKRPLHLFSQTTQDAEAYEAIASSILSRYERAKKTGPGTFVQHPSVCRQVSGRKISMQNFARSMDVLVFVAGRNSSNGKYLFSLCQAVNSRTHFIEHADELEAEWFAGAVNIGISGATSTPVWFLEQIKIVTENIIYPGQQRSNVS